MTSLKDSPSERCEGYYSLDQFVCEAVPGVLKSVRGYLITRLTKRAHSVRTVLGANDEVPRVGGVRLAHHRQVRELLREQIRQHLVVRLESLRHGGGAHPARQT